VTRIEPGSDPASPLLLGINLALTTAVGALFGLSLAQPLWVGAGGGFAAGVLILLLLGLVRRLRGVRVPRPSSSRLEQAAQRLLAPVGVLVGAMSRQVRRAGDQFNRWLRRWMPERPEAKTPRHRVRPALPPVPTGDLVSLVVGNLLLLLILAIFIFGIWVAYVVAVIATPLWLVALMLLALDGANPDRSIPLPDDLEAPE
jgi:hypothetical protein